jgi:hypothetical protein
VTLELYGRFRELVYQIPCVVEHTEFALLGVTKRALLNGYLGVSLWLRGPLLRLLAGYHRPDHFRKDRSRVVGHAISRRSKRTCESPASEMSPSSWGSGVPGASTLFGFAAVLLHLVRGGSRRLEIRKFSSLYVGSLSAGIRRIRYRFIWFATEMIILLRDASS